MNATECESPVRVVSTPQSWIESEAVRQLYSTAGLQGMKLAVGLPDLHPGRGWPVGAAFVTQGVIYPPLIGSDIGCGMGLWQTDIPRRKVRLDNWAALPFDLEQPWEGDLADWLASERLPSTGFDASLGSLGGGNHFAELQQVDDVLDASEFKRLQLSQDRVLLLVHSGSRGLGAAVLRAHLESASNDPVVPGSVTGSKYLGGHDLAVRWARSNRRLLAKRFLEMLGAHGLCLWDATHNAISSEGADLWVHRKGASPANDKFVVIPGSRGSFSYVVVPDSNLTATAWSLPHGAGRKWSRSQSRMRVREHQKAAQLTRTALGSRVICENRDLLYEEAPLAYKNVETVIEDLKQAGLIRVVARLRPLLTYKTRSARWE
ncbi:MAG: RNA ligase RtcB family protein [Verrucomicrobia subdivision 3 bacterium]|nr:RNA ligase RtcB family protein [Limisphaerales bacterium]